MFYLALLTVRLSGCTDITTVEQQPVVSIRDVIGGDMFNEGLFYLIGGVVPFADQTEPMGYTIDMGVDRQGRLPECHALDDIRRLPTHAR